MKHTQWSSTLAFIMAASGAAVGLGNIWKFPYMAGQHGGAGFILIYILLVAIVGLPLMMGEIGLGRLTRCNQVTAFEHLTKHHGCHHRWRLLSYWGSICLLLILSFYVVIASWSIHYWVWVLKGGLGTVQGNLNQFFQTLWADLMQDDVSMLIDDTLFLGITMLIVCFQAHQGIEKIAKVMMPALFMMLGLLAWYGLSLPRAQDAVHFMFHFSWDVLDRQSIFKALGQACFTLAIGVGCMLTYGAFLKPNSRLFSSSVIIAGLDVLVALLSGLAIFPIVMSFGMPASQGPGLMFVSLPVAFAQMHHGAFLALVFFTLLLFAAWTSTISLAEPLVLMLHEKTSLSRPKASLWIGILAWVLSMLSIASLSQHYPWANRLFDQIVFFSTDIMLPLGCMGYALLLGWVLPKNVHIKALGLKHGYRLWRSLVRYIAPVAIACIMLFSIMDHGS